MAKTVFALKILQLNWDRHPVLSLCQVVCPLLDSHLQDLVECPHPLLLGYSFLRTFQWFLLHGQTQCLLVIHRLGLLHLIKWVVPIQFCIMLTRSLWQEHWNGRNIYHQMGNRITLMLNPRLPFGKSLFA